MDIAIKMLGDMEFVKYEYTNMNTELEGRSFIGLLVDNIIHSHPEYVFCCETFVANVNKPA